MNESPDKDVSPPPAPQLDVQKTPLDNLKGILAEADNVAQDKGSSTSSLSVLSPQDTVSGSSMLIPKDIIRKVLLEAEALVDDKLSPRQVDSLLKPLIEANQLKDIQKYIEQRMEDTENMDALKILLAQIKTIPLQPNPEGKGPLVP